MYIQLNGQILYYEVTKEGSPLILLHGNGEDHHIFDSLIAKVEGYKIYAIDTRGHGLSAVPAAYHYQDMADDLCEFCDALDIEEPTVLGFSDGAIIAMLAACRGSLKPGALILCGGNLTPDGFKGDVRRKIKKRFKKTKDPLDQLMLTEPDLSSAELSAISCPVKIFAGQKDMIREKETNAIASAITNSELHILPNETHESYVAGSDFLASYL